MTEPADETRRLERLWAGDFGDAYTTRNLRAGDARRSFWSELLREHPVDSVLELGCNVGGNLRWIAASMSGGFAIGVDLNGHALSVLRREVPAASPVLAAGRTLPFADGAFELTLTAGVLIHQPSEALPAVMAELVRCSSRYVLCAEYYAPTEVDVPYRGQRGALFKRDYGGIYTRTFPMLERVAHGQLSRSEGWDDVTYWLFEKRST